MVPKELDELIKEYLTDGIITSKERQVLLKKAQQMGLDVDEIDLYIDAQQQKVDQAVETTKRNARGKHVLSVGQLFLYWQINAPSVEKPSHLKRTKN